MKAWQIFAAGVGVIVVGLLFPSYESKLAGMAAVVMVGVIAAGFLIRPRKDVFYLRTTLVVAEPDDVIGVEHDRIAVRVEVARLWLLFVPTFAAVAFLVVTYESGTTWKVDILDEFLIGPTTRYPLFLGVRVFLVCVFGILSTWISERWVLRDAEACSADSVSLRTGVLLYSFRRSGEYYGGQGVPFYLVRSPKLARIVFYKISDPQENKIAMGCLFHRPVIIGRGLTDLDEATAKSHPIKAEPAPQSL